MIAEALAVPFVFVSSVVKRALIVRESFRRQHRAFQGSQATQIKFRSELTNVIPTILHKSWLETTLLVINAQ